jgi:hypothetical protein
MQDRVIRECQGAVENLQGGSASHVGTVRVVEDIDGTLVWEGDVHVFALRGHPGAETAYSWQTPGGRTYAVLHKGPVNSPESAVRASIVQEYRGRGSETHNRDQEKIDGGNRNNA